MYGGSHKFGRGGGTTAVKRNSFPPPQAPPHRLPSSTASGRLSLGGSAPRGRNPSSSPAIAPSTEADESFNLVAGEPLSFAAIIRLAPDLVDEIKRVESLGGAAKIKFDPNPNNPLGNVIDVGGKEFRFTWSHEMGGLCDIYEERRSGEDGNGLLVESGVAWRKLNVQRVLDESTKNHVKKRSEEAERKLKSRKAIVLDQCNPTKSQVKELAAAEASPWKFKHKKDLQFKKRNFDPSQVGPSKNVSKPGSSSTSAVKGRCSASPLQSSPHQSVSLASPSVRGIVSESQAVTEDITPIHVRTKENRISSQNDFIARALSRTLDTASHRDNQVSGTMDLQNLLATLLKENPKGMSLKALEKAVGDVAPSSARKLDPILKKIATYEAPGKYTLKPGVELDSFKFSDTGSSPDDDHQRQYVPDENNGPASDVGFMGKSPAYDLGEQAPVNINFEEEPSLFGKIDASQRISNLFGEDDLPDNNEGQAASSSDSGSDSDSDSGSSDRSSDSGSQSPDGTASGSGSDSENDSSSNSKEGSDVDIDILNDDDKEPKNLHDGEHGLSTKPVLWSMPEARPVEDGGFGDQDGYTSEDIDIEKDLDDNEAKQAVASHYPTISTENLTIASPDRDQCQLYGVADVLDKQDDVEDKFKHEHPDSLEKSKGKSKRGLNLIQGEANAENVKRLKAGSMAQSSMLGYMGSSPLRSSPDITNEGCHENSNLQMQNKFNRDNNSNLGMHRGYDHPLPGKSAAELLQSGQRPVRAHGIDNADRFVKTPQNLGQDVKYQDANSHALEDFVKQGDKGRRGTQEEEGILNKKINGKFKEGGLDKKQLGFPDRHHKKHSEEVKKSNTMENSSRLHMVSPRKDKADFESTPIDKRRLQRELSDLELGELREPVTEEPETVGKQFERVGSFKQLENKLGTSGPRNADLKGKTGSKAAVDMGNLPFPNLRTGIPVNSDSWPKKRSPEPYTEETTRPANSAMQSQQQPSRAARSEVSSLSNKPADFSRSRQHGTDQATDVEGYGETQKKSQNGTQVENSRQHLGSRRVKGNKSRKANTLTDATDRRKDVFLIEGRNGKRKTNESSSDENSSYSKYEKEEPELKGPIKNFSQYKEYVQEYCEKYDSYCSLNKNLQRYRINFQKLGMDLESAKGRDMERYYNILAQLRERYQQCGTRHKRLKKIFLVLHEELKHLKQRIKDFAADYTRD